MGYSPFYFGWSGYESVDFGGSRAQFWAQLEGGPDPDRGPLAAPCNRPSDHSIAPVASASRCRFSPSFPHPVLVLFPPPSLTRSVLYLFLSFIAISDWHHEVILGAGSS